MKKLILALVFISYFLVPGTVSAQAVAWLDAMHVPAARALKINTGISSVYTGKDVVVGIIDCGVQTTHTRLSGAMYQPTLNLSYTYTSSSFTTVPGCEPFPSVANNHHGTAVAGCVLGTGQNNIHLADNAKLVGIRFDFDNQVTVDMIADALLYQNDVIQIKNCSWGYADGFVPISTATPYLGGIVMNPGSAVSAIQQATREGEILIFSAGNSRTDNTLADGKDANKKAYQAAPQTLVVGSVTQNGANIENFSCFGANVFVTTPGRSITTTGLYDSVSQSFSGTSASAPLMSGVAALAVEAAADNPNGIPMNSRLLKHLLVKTSTNTGLGSAGYTGDPTASVAWVTNAAGNKFSHSYGFGLVNAEALIAATISPDNFGVTEQTILNAKWNTAQQGTTVQYTTTLNSFSSLQTVCYARATLGGLRPIVIAELPENAEFSNSGTISAGQLTTFDACPAPVLNDYTTGQITLNDSLTDPALKIFETTAFFTDANFVSTGVLKQSLEEVAITVAVSSTHLEDFQLELTSPWGTTSTLCFADTAGLADSGDILWTFTSNAFWGEEIVDPAGIRGWTLCAYDMNPANGGITMYLTSLYSTFYMGEMLQPMDLDDIQTPEPAAWGMFLLGGIILLWMRRTA